MAILVNKDTRVIIQGITGREGRLQTPKMLEYGTKVVAGVTPGKGGETFKGVPVYDSVKSATREHPADVSIMFVPAPYVKDACLEAIECGLRLIVVITELVPVHDMLEIRHYADKEETILIGPNTPGIITPNRTKIGVMPTSAYRPGVVGIMSRSGTLSYQITDSLTRAGLGQSTCLGIGGDPVVGLSFAEALRLYNEDRETEAVLMIGEIGGSQEEVAAEYIKKVMSKPVVAYVAGLRAPPDRRMGHAGAIVQMGRGRAEDKISAMKDAEVRVASEISEIPKLVKAALSR